MKKPWRVINLMNRIGFQLRKNILPTLIMLIVLAISMALAARATENQPLVASASLSGQVLSVLPQTAKLTRRP